MNRHSGLHRHSPGEDSAGDPLDGLVNLFDIGIVLAVAFLIAGLSIALDRSAHNSTKPIATSAQSTQQTHTLPPPAAAKPVSGRGEQVGTVYRLANGQLVYVQQSPSSPSSPHR
jgi:hypothetical protein